MTTLGTRSKQAPLQSSPFFILKSSGTRGESVRKKLNPLKLYYNIILQGATLYFP